MPVPRCTAAFAGRRSPTADCRLPGLSMLGEPSWRTPCQMTVSRPPPCPPTRIRLCLTRTRRPCWTRAWRRHFPPVTRFPSTPASRMRHQKRRGARPRRKMWVCVSTKRRFCPCYVASETIVRIQRAHCRSNRQSNRCAGRTLFRPGRQHASTGKSGSIHDVDAAHVAAGCFARHRLPSARRGIRYWHVAGARIPSIRLGSGAA